MRLFRWKALVPLFLFVGGLGLLWLIFLDTLVERTVENFGTEIVGALVEVDEADVRLTEGFVTLRGLRVTNPDAPMTNLIEATEIVADIRIVPLLQKKIFIDTLAMRGLRFGTARQTSGAIEGSTATNREIRRQIDAWAERVRIPDFSLAGLGQAVNASAIRAESLQTPAYALQLIASIDSSRRAWETAVADLNPDPLIDSGRVLVARLQSASPRTLGVTGLVQTLRTARSVQARIASAEAEIRALDDRVRDGLTSLQVGITTLDDLRARDLAYARSLLRIPSADTPDLSPSIFGSFAVSKIKPLLYWAQFVDRYLPPGLNPRRRPGPKRFRLDGADVAFPSAGALPKFTLAFGEASLTIGGAGAVAGNYQGVMTGLSSAPAALGIPLRISASRSDAVAGPGDIGFNAIIDRVGNISRDSVTVRVAGVRLPALTVPGLGATLDLGTGVSSVQFLRTGDEIAGTLRWQANAADWQRVVSPSTGIQARVEDLIWRTVSAVRDVDLEVRFSGNALGPSLAIRSNIGTAISRSLRQQLSAEIDAAEAIARAEVDRVVGEPIRQTRARIVALETEVHNVIATQRAAIEEIRAQLEARINKFTTSSRPNEPLSKRFARSSKPASMNSGG